MKRGAITPEMLSLMSLADQAKYGSGVAVPVIVTPPGRFPVRNKTTRLERVDQGVFAQWCWSHGYAFTWHRTDKPSTASPGTPDFIVGAKGQTYWIEFKREGETLSDDQAEFRDRLAAQGIMMHVVRSDAEAIALVESKADQIAPMARPR